MTTLLVTSGSPSCPPRNEDVLPWPVLLLLGGATLVMVTGEMLPTALLPQMSLGLGVSEARTGLLVSLWAAVVVVASFPLVRLTRQWDRRRVIAVSMAIFAVSAALTAAAPSYTMAFAARSLGAAAVGLLWSTVNAYVADLVPDRLLGRATAVVLGGATLGMVFGTPIARFLADLSSWRVPFWTLAGVGLVMAVRLWTLAPVRIAPASDDSHQAGGTRSLRPMMLMTGLVGLVIVGHYATYTYITRLAEAPAALLTGGMATLLLAFGVASAVGVVVAGRVVERPRLALVLSTATTAAALLGLQLVDQRAWFGLAVVIAWGVVSGALPPLAQTQILRLAGPEFRWLAGPEFRWLAGTLIPVLFNGAIAVGAALASAVVAQEGVGAIPARAAILVLLATVGLAVAMRAEDRRRILMPPVVIEPA